MSTSGLLYAASRLNSPSRKSSDVFNTWYNDIHVRDVLKTSGINSAARYETAAVPQDSSPWTFLALYPVPDIEFLNTGEFTSIPVTSDVLLGPTNSCMDIAHFDIRRYREVGRREDSDMPAGPTSHLITVEFDLPSHIDKADDQAVMDWFTGIYSSNGAPQRVAIHEVFWAMLFPNGKPAEPPRYLALLELNGDDNVYDEAIKKIQLVANVGQWKVHKIFD
ncbi:uncharacterized protein BO87DRAFT_362667 [Aspergillus neoniger CBS 115656]|uniref:EthD domain-containing protein n=1 Tax=Aspergillus neoniger (strain CBS 115656) TaxID=1448310 RepID=A0A318YEW7_ASPNB|nr:hypothetical protein BO87DRAFT_362667 [Aspergillus neoniger CBS 115656]PYH32659.1 hypothetical protein BO87DRAFT_362667 [Aspergillus neoniger CBS 115656]